VINELYQKTGRLEEGQTLFISWPNYELLGQVQLEINLTLDIINIKENLKKKDIIL
jgi:hypothetical protein